MKNVYTTAFQNLNLTRKKNGNIFSFNKKGYLGQWPIVDNRMYIVAKVMKENEVTKNRIIC